MFFAKLPCCIRSAAKLRWQTLTLTSSMLGEYTMPWRKCCDCSCCFLFLHIFFHGESCCTVSRAAVSSSTCLAPDRALFFTSFRRNGSPGFRADRSNFLCYNSHTSSKSSMPDSKSPSSTRLDSARNDSHETTRCADRVLTGYLGGETSHGGVIEVPTLITWTRSLGRDEQS